MAVDVNFDNLTLAVFTLDGRVVRLKRLKTPLKKMLTHRIWIERIQRRYPESWRFIKGVKRAIKRHGERIRSISWDYSHKIGDLIADLAFRYNSIIILEDLEKLRENAKKNSKFNKKLTVWFYRRTQFCVEYEAKERGVRVIRVNPKGTSSKCPKCSSRLVDNGYRTLRCSKCGFIRDRGHSSGSKPIQEAHTSHKMWGSWGGPERPRADAPPRSDEGEQR
jgi:putative transposase